MRRSFPVDTGGVPPESAALLAQATGDIVGRAGRYPDGHRVMPHRHDRAQLLLVRAGVALTATAVGRWMIPAGTAMWIPAGIEHSVEMLGEVAMQSLYLKADRLSDQRAEPHVLHPTDLMRSLVGEVVAATEDGVEDERMRLLQELVLHELPRLAAAPLSLPLPVAPRIMALCRAFLDDPSRGAAIDDWAASLGMSRRSFTRSFQRETGISLSTWRQQACVLAALPRLARGDHVTAVALDLGYDSAAAFTTMFRRTVGVSPRAYVFRTLSDDPSSDSTSDMRRI